MPIFELEANGKTFEIDAPSMQVALSVLGPPPAPAPSQFTRNEAENFYDKVGMPQRSMAEIASDAGKSLISGIGRGLTGLAGMPADAAKGMRDLEDIQRTGLGLQPKGNNPTPAYGAQGLQQGLESYVGKLHQPETRAGKYAERIGEFAPNAALPGGVVRRAANVLLPAGASEAAGQATEGTSAEVPARLLGAVAGSLAIPGAARLATPFPATAERSALAATLDAEGVPMTAGQRTGNRPLQWLEQAAADTPLASGRATAINEDTGRRFTGAALRRMGMSGDEIATPQAIDAGVRNLSQRFEALSARNTLVPDQPFGNDVIRTAQNYVDTVIPSQRAAGRQNVETIIHDLLGTMQQQGGVMPGQLYQATRSRLSSMSEGVRQADPQLSTAIRGIRNALDGAMDRSISPGDRQAWREARTQWKNWKAIEKAVSGAGSAVAEGYISPSQLRSAVAGQNRGQYARGQGDMAMLARAGEALLRPLPQSGTAPRQAAGNLFASLAGGGVGAAAGGPLGAVVGSAVPALVGRAMLSRPVQAYLGNQAAPGPSYPLAQAAAAAVNADNSNRSNRRGDTRDVRSRLAAAILKKAKH
jgi:hypothetical protein